MPARMTSVAGMSDETILILDFKESDCGGRIALVRLNRPQVLNAISMDTLRELERVITEIERTSDVRILIITGNDLAFSSGADLKERMNMAHQEIIHFLDLANETINRIEKLSIPTVAAINGYALGLGLELALCCDLRLASRQAIMGLVETSLGVIPGGGGTQRLTRLIGPARSKELIFTARKFDARTALELGIINRLAEPEDLVDAAMHIAQEICHNAPLALTEAKKAIDSTGARTLEKGLQQERLGIEKTLDSEDREEAMRACQEKRKPVFRGE